MLHNILSKILAVVLIVTSLFLSTNNMISSASAANTEIIELRGSNYKVFQQEDGNQEYRFYPVNIHYQDKDGIYQDIDTSFIEVNDDMETDYRYRNKANDWYAYFGDIKNENYILLTKGKYEIRYSILNSNNEILAQKANDDINLTNEDYSFLSGDNTLIYKNVYPGTDIYYNVGFQDLKEYVVINKYSGICRFDFRISLTGLEFKDNNGLLEFIDPQNGETIFSISPPYVEDSNGNYCEDVFYTWREDGDGIVISLNVSGKFLVSDDTMYPVIIDPTFSGPSYTWDTFVACQCANPENCSCTNPDCMCNKNFNTTAAGSNRYYLRTGKDVPYGVRRIYINYKNVYTAISGKQIDSAYLFFNRYTYSGAISIRAYELASVFNNSNSTTLTWRSRIGYNSYTESDKGQSVTGTNWYKINVEGIVQKWANYGSDIAYGFMVKDDIENNTSVWATFCSSDHTDSARLPYLSVTTSTRPSVNNVGVSLRYDETYMDYYGSTAQAQIFLYSAAYSFIHKYNITFTPSIRSAYGLPGHDCPLDPTDICTNASCGSRCMNDTSTPNHHKNGYRTFYLTNNYYLYGQDIQLLFLRHDMCYTSPSGYHGHVWGLALGNYVLVPIDADQEYNTIHTIQHEISHIFGCADHNATTHPCTPGQRCIMGGEGGFNYIQDYRIPDVWCDRCESEFNRTAH